MNILFFGDIVGKIGRQAIKEIMPELKKEYEPDLVIANVENLAHGSGITPKTLQEVKEAGIDVFTSGNHIFKKSHKFINYCLDTHLSLLFILPLLLTKVNGIKNHHLGGKNKTVTRPTGRQASFSRPVLYHVFLKIYLYP